MRRRDEVYPASLINPKRHRSTRAEVERRRELLRDIIESMRPMTVRQVFWDLPPSRPTKASDSRAKGFGDISVELDAIEPDRLRELVQGAIEQHLPPQQFEVLRVAEESERSVFERIAELFNPDIENFVGDGSGSGHWAYERRLAQIDEWIRRGAPAPPNDEEERR